MKNETVIYGINGPVVTVKAAQSFSMMEMVYVGKGWSVKSSVSPALLPRFRYMKRLQAFAQENP